MALVGDYNPDVAAHRAIPLALDRSARALGRPVAPVWMGTRALARDGVERSLGAYVAIWCVPASPYENTDAALAAIRFARESGRPFLGTCGGFQYAVIEYARNVLGMTDADHAETNPQAARPLIAPLACPLVERSGALSIRDDSKLRQIYGTVGGRDLSLQLRRQPWI